jgi:hypothetical protein
MSTAALGPFGVMTILPGDLLAVAEEAAGQRVRGVGGNAELKADVLGQLLARGRRRAEGRLREPARRLPSQPLFTRRARVSRRGR